MKFLVDFDFMQNREEQIIRDLNIKLEMATKLRRFHEKLKNDFHTE